MLAFKLLLLFSATSALRVAGDSHSSRSGFIKQRRSHVLAGRALGDLVGAVDGAAAAATGVVEEAATASTGVGRQLEGSLSSIVIVKAAVEASTISARPTTASSSATSTATAVPIEISTSTSSAAPTSSAVQPTTNAVASTTAELTAFETSTTSLLEPTQSTTLPTTILTDSIVTSAPFSLPASLRTVTAASRFTTRPTTYSTSSPTAATLAAETTKPSATKITFVTLGIIGGGVLALLIGFTLLRKFVFAKKSDKFDDRLVSPKLWPSTEGGDRRSWESFGSRGMSAIGGGASFALGSSVGGKSAGANVGSSSGNVRSEARNQAGREYGIIKREGGNALVVLCGAVCEGR